MSSFPKQGRLWVRIGEARESAARVEGERVRELEEEDFPKRQTANKVREIDI